MFIFKVTLHGQIHIKKQYIAKYIFNKKNSISHLTYNPAADWLI